MKLRLDKLTYSNRDKIAEMVKEWNEYNENNNANRSPTAIFRNDIDDFDNYLEHLEHKEERNGRVHDSVYFCFDEEINSYVGAVNIRHYLNEGLLKTGGHIGDGIRPKYRNMGYGTAMISLALKECHQLGINRVLMTCDKINVPSASTIINNGGVLENEVDDEGMIVQRYWIDLEPEYDL